MKKMDRVIQPPLVNCCSVFNLYSISSALVYTIFSFFNDGMYLLGMVVFSRSENVHLFFNC